jgi:NADH dehydrogenase
MRVAIFGGTGFVGGYLVEALLVAGHEPSVLVRPGSEHKLRRRGHCRTVRGDLSDDQAVMETLEGCDALIYNVGLLREFPGRGITFEEAHFGGVRRVAGAAKQAGVNRFLLMSANGVRPDGTTYQSTKYRAEQLVWEQGFASTIFRPSVIFGDPHGLMEIATQLCRDLVEPPLPAVAFHSGLRPAEGQLFMSPVSVRDVADAFVNALVDPTTVGTTITLGGPETLSWTEMIRRVADAAGREKIILPMPVALMKFGATLFDWLPFFPVTRDQLRMLVDGNAASPDELRRLIGRDPLLFAPENLRYLRDE